MEFVLQPCKVRRRVLVRVKGSDPFSIPWRDLLPKLGLTAETAPSILAAARVGGYLGVRQADGRGRAFYLETPDFGVELPGTVEDEVTATFTELYRIEAVHREVVRAEAVGDAPLAPVYGDGAIGPEPSQG